MKKFGYPKETRGLTSWSNKRQYIGPDGRLWWCEGPDFWWTEDGDVINDPSELDVFGKAPPEVPSKFQLSTWIRYRWDILARIFSEHHR